MGSPGIDVGKALRNCSKGQIKYDKYWLEEGRTQEFLDEVSKYSKNVVLNVSPKVLSQVLKKYEKDEVDHEENKNVSCGKANNKTMPKKSRDTDIIFYQLQTETELPIQVYEEERLKYIQDIFNEKKKQFEIFSKNLKQQTEQQYHLQKRNIELDGKRRAADLKRIEDSIIEEAKEKEIILKQHQQTQAKKLSAIVLEAELKQKKAEEELRKKEQEQQEFALQLNSCKLEAESSVSKIQGQLVACEYPSFLKIAVVDRVSQLKQFLEDINSIVQRVQSEPITIGHILSANDIIKNIYHTFQDVTNDIEHAKVKGLQAHEKKVLERREEVSLAVENVKPISSESGSAAVPTMHEGKVGTQMQTTDKTNAKSKLKKEVQDLISTFIAPDVVEEHHKIMENLKNIQTGVQPFVDDARNKKERFELQKSIIVPINAISSVSGAHVRDKIARLLTILSAKTPKKDLPNEHVIYNFCANLVARKFVEQGDLQISAQHSTAFPIALAVVGVWIKKPDIGLLILGHFYSKCPYLVPYYPPRKENQSDQEYYEILGYQFDKEGKLEEKYKFLNRMSGYMRLYAAIILSPVPPSSTKYPHPYGIAHAWKWLSRTLNIEPRPDITATLLYDFLDVMGHALQNTYGKQFKKLLHIICKDFFQKIKRVTPSGSSGPIGRLETFLQQSVKKGYIPPPEGILYADFWNR